MNRLLRVTIFLHLMLFCAALAGLTDPSEKVRRSAEITLCIEIGVFGLLGLLAVANVANRD